MSDGVGGTSPVIAVLVINRLLAPCALSNIAEWVNKTGLHILLGIADPELLNYDRLADAQVNLMLCHMAQSANNCKCLPR